MDFHESFRDCFWDALKGETEERDDEVELMRQYACFDFAYALAGIDPLADPKPPFGDDEIPF
jgi:hypothetical protein